MFDSRFEDQKVSDEPVYKSELSLNGSTFGTNQPLFTNKNSGLVTNTIAETSIIPPLINGSTTIPANTLQAGDIIETIIAGQYVKTIPANRTFTFSIKLGSYFGTQLILSQVSLTILTGSPFKIVHYFKMVDNGGNIEPRPYNSTLTYGSLAPAITTIQQPISLVLPIGYNNTVDNDIDATVQMSVADVRLTLETKMITSTIIKLR